MSDPAVCGSQNMYRKRSGTVGLADRTNVATSDAKGYVWSHATFLCTAQHIDNITREQMQYILVHRHVLALTLFSRGLHSTAQHSTAQHITAQNSTAQHSTAQHSIRHLPKTALARSL